MNILFKSCVLLIALLIAGGVSAEPTVEETKAFITSKVAICGKFSASKDYSDGDDVDIRSWSYNNRDISFVNDEVHITEEYKWSKNTSGGEGDNSYYYSWYRQSHRTSISKLGDLSLDVELDPGDDDENPFLILKCSSKECWKHEYKSYNIKAEETQYGLPEFSESVNNRFFICNLDTAERIQKAFIHLLKKSGVKESLF